MNSRRISLKVLQSYGKNIRLTRRFCSSSNIVTTSLAKPLPGFPNPIFATADTQKHKTQITRLDNGLRVATEKKFGQFCTVGVVIDSGSRYEHNYMSGISHFLQKLAFSSTRNFANRDEILRVLENESGICDCQGSRDTLIYAASAQSKGLSKVVELLSEVVLQPQITEIELQDAQMAIAFELENMELQGDPEPFLNEIIHSAAYNENTLGLPKFCPPHIIPNINRASLFDYLRTYHTPDRMVIAGVGMEHDALVELADKYFTQKPSWEEESLVLPSIQGIDRTAANYTGGFCKVEKDLSNLSYGPNPLPENAHMAIAFESCSHQDPDFIAFCVLNMLMGGGGSFSAGGPGKGMYTRLYTNVLNRHHWINNAVAYNHAYNDSGLFCIHAGADPQNLRNLFEVIIKEFLNMANEVNKVELARAKTQLQSMLLMNLESRPVLFEDVARQVLANGKREAAEYYFNEIEKIQAEDLSRAANRMLQSVPSVAAYGNLSNLPSYSEVHSAFSSRNSRLSRFRKAMFFG